MRVLSTLETVFQAEEEHGYMLKKGLIDYKCLTIIVKQLKKERPEMELECRQQQSQGGLWEAHAEELFKWYELRGRALTRKPDLFCLNSQLYITILALLGKFFHLSMHVSFSSSIK